MYCVWDSLFTGLRRCRWSVLVDEIHVHILWYQQRSVTTQGKLCNVTKLRQFSCRIWLVYRKGLQLKQLWKHPDVAYICFHHSFRDMIWYTTNREPSERISLTVLHARSQCKSTVFCLFVLLYIYKQYLFQHLL